MHRLHFDMRVFFFFWLTEDELQMLMHSSPGSVVILISGGVLKI